MAAFASSVFGTKSAFFLNMSCQNVEETHEELGMF
jgi:hypothetical protein